MANNYTHFSFAFKINSPAEAEYLETVLQSADSYDEGGTAKDIADDVFEDFEEYQCLGFDCNIECGADGGEVWIHDDGGEGNVDYVVQFLQAYMLKFKITKPIAFEFAVTCDMPRVGEFGGGAVVVTAHDDKWINTAQWIRETIKEMA
jgi:hypothetical protein